MPPPQLIAQRGARLFTLIFAGCIAVLGIALYLQYAKNLDPCAWCVVQRVLFVLIGLIALIAVLHRPQGIGVTAYGTVIGLVSMTGIAAATYHIYLQSDPLRAGKCAGSFVERLLDQSALGKIVPPLFQYDGPCTLKPWAMLGLSIPEWSLIAFVLVLIAVGAGAFLGRR